MPNIVDLVAGTMPWAGSLVPTAITFRNLQDNLAFELPEALIVAGVVEGLGFVTITTALDLYEQVQAEHNEGLPVARGRSVWVAVGGVVAYIVVVELVNMILEPGDTAHKATMGLLSLFGLLGGLMVALRNQLGKRRTALADARSKREQAERDQVAQEAVERARAAELQAEIEREEREHARRMKEERLRLAHELKVKKLESSNAPETFQKDPDGASKFPETFGKWSDWRKVPENVRESISKLANAEQVSERFGVSVKVGGLWLKRSKRGGER